MPSDFDAEEFIDEDYKASPLSAASEAAAADPNRAPTREEVESRVTEMQKKLADLKRAQQDLERQRASLEELRRRQAELTTGRQEMTHQLVRGIALLEEAELSARREVEQLSKTLLDFREALAKLQSIQEETWTKETLEVELTRANTIVENARMEWNTAMVKLPLLSGDQPTSHPNQPIPGENPIQTLVRQQNYAELCKLGLALTWPVALTGLAIFLLLLIR
jgi:chromosome segregation ATPase